MPLLPALILCKELTYHSTKELQALNSNPPTYKYTIYSKCTTGINFSFACWSWMAVTATVVFVTLSPDSNDNRKYEKKTVTGRDKRILSLIHPIQPNMACTYLLLLLLFYFCHVIVSLRRTSELVSLTLLCLQYISNSFPLKEL